MARTSQKADTRNNEVANPTLAPNLPATVENSINQVVDTLLALPALSAGTTLEDHMMHDALLFYLEAQQLVVRWKDAHKLNTKSFAMLSLLTHKFLESRRKLFLKAYRASETKVEPSRAFVLPLD